MKSISSRHFRFLWSVYWVVAPPPPHQYVLLLLFYDRQTSITTSQMVTALSMPAGKTLKSSLVVFTWGLLQSNLWLVFNGLQSLYWKGIFITITSLCFPKTLPAGWCLHSWTLVRSFGGGASNRLNHSYLTSVPVIGEHQIRFKSLQIWVRGQ